MTLIGVALTGNTALGGSSGVAGMGGAGGGIGGDGGGGAAGSDGIYSFNPFDGVFANGTPGANGGFGGGGGAGGTAAGGTYKGGARGGNGGNGGFGSGGGGNGGNNLSGASPSFPPPTSFPGGGGFGGGFNEGGGAGMGGAVFVMDSFLTVINSTLAGNSALGGTGYQGGAGYGGAVFNLNGVVTVLDSTLDGNGVASGASGLGVQSVSSDGGAAYNLYGGLILANSILADSRGGSDLANNAGTVTATGPNLIGSTTATISGPAPLTGEPLLGPLQDNGGLSPTMALLPGSPAIDAGSNAIANASGLTTDQRGTGFPRVVGPAVDLGAYKAPPSAELTSQERFVQALYRDELGRNGTVSELDGWVALLNQPGETPADVAAGVADSPEALDRVVRGWYQTYLGRPAEGGEELSWVNLLQQGQSGEQVLAGILGEPEFFNRAQTLAGSGTPQERYVQGLYQVLLGRTGSVDEIAGWVNALPVLGSIGVAQAIQTSPEYRTEATTAYYKNLLGRSPDAAGLNSWVFSNLDLLAVHIGFEGSPEFYNDY